MSLPNQIELLKTFSSFLIESGLSAVSVKNYLCDLRHFLAFCGSIQQATSGNTSSTGSETNIDEVFQSVTKYINIYVENQKSVFTPQSTINRRLASIRRFTTFLNVRFGVPNILPITQPHQNTSPSLTGTATKKEEHVSTTPVLTTDKILEQFKASLEKEKKTHSTVKNYLSDLNHFFLWTANQTPYTIQNLVNILSESQLSAYVTYLRLSRTSDSVINRRQSSIKKLTKFCATEKYIPENPFEIKQTSQGLAPLSWIERLSRKPKTAPSAPKSRLAIIYSKYNALPFTPYLHIAILVLATTAMAIFGFNQIISQARPSAAATALTAPKRQLSFQGRLTDSGGTPITTAVNITFKLWNALTGPTQLYSTGVCSITPDTNGIFNTLIGDTVCGAEINSSVFTDNRDVYLELTVGAETLTPRQQIATVGYAINSYSLQGYPASASATANTVPVMDNNGNIVLGQLNPSIIATASSGTFTVKGDSLSFQTNINSGGNIVMQPDAIGGGQILAIGGTTNKDTFRITNANLTNGSLISGYVGNDTATGRLLSLTSGSTETDRFFVARDGRVLINATATNSALIVNQNGTGDIFTASVSGTNAFVIKNSGNVGIGITNPNTKLGISNAVIGNFNGLLIQNNEYGAGTYLTSNSTSISLGRSSTHITGQITSSNSVDGALDRGYMAFSTRVTDTVTERMRIDSAGNVGIGTTNPGTALEIGGGQLSVPVGTAAIPSYSFTGDLNTGMYRSSSDFIGFSAGGTASVFIGTATNTPITGVNKVIALSGSIDLGNMADNYIYRYSGNMILQSSGNVGIGTTTPAAASKLDVNGNINVNGYATISASLAVGYTNAPGVPGGAIFRNNVGIGTTNPFEKLDISGNLLVNNSSNTQIGGGIFLGNGSNTRYWAVRNATTGNSFNIDSFNGGGGLITPLTILSGGNVGIGTTTPTAKLDIAGDASTSGALVFRGANPATIDILNGDRLDFQTSPGGDAGLTSKMTLTAAGNLGLGITNPTSKLYVLGSTTGNLFTLNDSVNDVVNISSAQSTFNNPTAFTSPGDVSIAYDLNFTNPTGSFIKSAAPLTIAAGEVFNSSNLSLQTYNKGNIVLTSEAVTFSNSATISGSLGIGLTNPAYKLDLTGDFNIASGGIRAAGTFGTPGYILSTTGTGVQWIVAPTTSGNSSPWNWTAGVIFPFSITDAVNLGNAATNSATVHLAGISTDDSFFNAADLGVGVTNPLARFDVRGNLGTVPVASFSGATAKASMIIDQSGLGDIFAASTSGTTRFLIARNGDVTLTGGVKAGGSFGSAGNVLSSTGTGVQWIPASAGSGSNWTVANGTIYPNNGTLDLLVGGNSTASAKFAFMNVSSGTPTASISGTLGSTFLDANGNLSTTNRQSLTLGNSATYNTTGNILLNPNGTGNVGIGITNPTDAKLIVIGNTSIGAATANSATLTVKSTGGNILGLKNSGGTEVITADNSGNLGVGTTTPAAKTVISGGVLTSGTGEATNKGYLQISGGGGLTSSAGGLEFKMAESGSGYGWRISSPDLGTGEVPMYFQARQNSAAWTNQLTLLGSNGNVGIGTTTPTAKLDVAGDASTSGSLVFRGSNPSTIDVLNGNRLDFQTSAGGDAGLATRMTIANNGMVGIGVTNPANALQISGNIQGNGRIYYGDGTVGFPTYSFISDPDNGMYHYGTNSISLVTAGTDRLVIDGSGNLGVGVTNPAGFFSVGSGSPFQINTTGAITAATGIVSSGNIDFASLAAGGLVKAATTSGRLSIASAGTDFEVPLTFNNGLTRTANTVALGGQLLANTNIDQQAFSMTFTGAGNFGIGAAAPSQKLDVAGFFVVDTTNSRVGIGTTTPAAKLDIGGSTSTISNSAGDITINAASGILNFSGNSLNNFLNATASGQIKFGNFSTAGLPTALGTGSVIYNSDTFKLNFWNGTSWGEIGTNFFQRDTAGIISPIVSYDSINIGGASSASALIRLSTNNSFNTFFKNPVAIGFTSAMSPTTNVALQTYGDILPQTTDIDSLGRASYGFLNLFLKTGINRSSDGTQIISTALSYLTGPVDWHVATGLTVNTTGALPAGMNFYVNGNATVSGTLGSTGSLYVGGTSKLIGDVTVGGGSGKMDVGTVDPPYTINGEKYATYMASMIGVKEEVMGKVTVSDYIEGVGYRALIDLSNQPQGEDLWLFSKTTDLRKNISKMSVLLTAEGQAKTWYQVDTANRILAVYSSTPSNVDYRLTAPRFDDTRWANTRTTSATGFVLNDPDNTSSDGVGIFNTIAIAPELIPQLDGTYKLTVNGSESKEVSSFASSIIANFKAGIATVTDLVATNLTVRTKLISPIADIDQLKVNDATIAGTLYADNIQGRTIDTLNSQLDLLNSKYATASAILADLQAKYTSYASILGATSSATITGDPLALSALATTSATIPSDIALNSLNVHTLIANDVMANGSVFAQSLSSFNSDLYIQPTGDKSVHILANLMTLYPDGKVVVNGDLLITGTIYANNIDTRTATVSGSLALGKGDLATDSGKLIALFGKDGQVVGSVDASGSANFGQLTTDGLVIASGNANQTATISGTTSSNTTIGTATIATGSSELIIANNKITDTTLVYITPISNTDNQVLYVKSKQSGVGFTVAVPSPLPNEVSFNYWLVQTK